MDELVQKVEFDGPSLTIKSKYLAVGISAFNASSYNGSTFSAFIASNTTDPQVKIINFFQWLFFEIFNIFGCLGIFLIRQTKH